MSREANLQKVITYLKELVDKASILPRKLDEEDLSKIRGVKTCFSIEHEVNSFVNATQV